MKEIKLKEIRIEVVEIGRHMLTSLINVFSSEKMSGKVMRINIVGIYGDGIIQEMKGLNLMEGDGLTIKVIKKHD